MKSKELSPAKELLYYGGISPEEYQRIIPTVQSANYKKLLFMTIITAVFLCADFLAKFLFTKEHLNITIHLTCIFVNLAILAVLRLTGRKDSRFLNTMIYLYSINLLTLGIIVNTILMPDERAVAYFVYIMMTPMLFTIKPIKMISLIIVSDFIFMGLVFLYKTPKMIPYDIANALIFGLASILMACFQLKLKFSHFYLQDTLQRIAMTDQLTHLKNRNCFTLKLPEYGQLFEKSLDCIYIDVNGLHELNNSQGHAAGDQMLCRTATVLRDAFGEDDTYRIGGDEFLIFVMDGDEETLKTHLTQAIQKIESYGYHVAHGHARQVNAAFDINTLICSAEEKMYDAKRNYYTQPGANHRSRKIQPVNS